MDFSGQGAAFSHDPIEFLLTISTVAVTWWAPGRICAHKWVETQQDSRVLGCGSFWRMCWAWGATANFISSKKITRLAMDRHTIPAFYTCGDPLWGLFPMETVFLFFSIVTRWTTSQNIKWNQHFGVPIVSPIHQESIKYMSLWLTLSPYAMV